MISTHTFLLGLLMTSVFTGLVTEGIKKVLAEHDKTYPANTLAGLVAIILSAAFSVGYALFTSTAFTTQIVVLIVALIFLSWLCAMVGYDKVIQAITQFKTYREGEDK